MRTAILSRLAAGLLLCSAGLAAAGFDPGYAAFSIRVGEQPVDYREFTVSVLPGEALEVEVTESGTAEYTLWADGAVVPGRGNPGWAWTAPDTPGLHELRIRRADGETVSVRVFVLRPFDAAGTDEIQGYRIGHYPRHPLRDNPVYLAPHGFIEVTEDMLDLRVTPHFTLGQFLCKQQPETWPKYLVLREPLLAKLETLLDEVNRRGIRTDTFFVMSGYRTPSYNEAIGNVAYSRHLWGGAADIFIDNDGDGIMDDLNGDGRLDIKDARVLQRIALELSGDGIWRRLLGGIGLYGPRIHRGSFVHLDARGNMARWEVP